MDRKPETPMSDDMKQRWESIERELRTAMARLSEAIEKAREELPDTARAINEEYLRMQEKLDKAVEELRK